MIQPDVYNRIDLIDKLLRNAKDILSDSVIELLYDELEILCEVILESKKAKGVKSVTT
ncbi:MAG: hypothetical protein K0R55_1877 [Sporomusa sp.]|nr:hypothetical protein [Sporomusa sp.]